MSNKYIKKPIIVEAVQVVDGNRETVQKIYELGIGDALCELSIPVLNTNAVTFYVETLEGRMEGHENDWIVKGIRDEFYIVKDEIFKETYQKFDEEYAKLVNNIENKECQQD